MSNLTDPFRIDQLKFLLSELHKNKKPGNQRKFLIDCIEKHGYIKKSNESIDDTFEEVAYSEITNEENEGNQGNQWNQDNQNNQNYVRDLKYNYTRTFFNPESKEFTRLAEIQKYGIDPEEMQLAKISEKIDNALNVLSVNELENVKNVAMNIYYNILLYYNSGNPFGLLTNTGSIKKGFIALCLFYALKSNKIMVSKEKVVRAFEGEIMLSDLVTADKNIHRIFEKSPGYSFIYESVYDLCGFSFDISLTQQIKETLNEIKEVIPISAKSIGAAIYYVHKNNKKKITFEEIANKCKNVSASTISKCHKEIIAFYQNR